MHFAVGDLGSHMPLGSWILLRGSEKKAIITQLAEVYDVNGDLSEVAQQQIPDEGGYLRKVLSFFIADTKARRGRYVGELLLQRAVDGGAEAAVVGSRRSWPPSLCHPHPWGPVRNLGGTNRVGWIPNCEDAAPPT